jgi:hypothetical protein
MAWDDIGSETDLFDLSSKGFIATLRKAIWERILVVIDLISANDPTRPLGSLVPSNVDFWVEDDWTFHTNGLGIGEVPTGSMEYYLAGQRTDLVSINSYVVKFWLREYPYEIHSLTESLLNFPIGYVYNNVYEAFGDQFKHKPVARYVWLQGTSPIEEKSNDGQLFYNDASTWKPVKNILDPGGSPINPVLPTTIIKYGPPKEGDYAMQMWMRWINIMQNINKHFIDPTTFREEGPLTSVVFDNLASQPIRRFPKESPSMPLGSTINIGDVYQVNSESNKYYLKAIPKDVPQPDLKIPTVGAIVDNDKKGPYEGDYFTWVLVKEAIDWMKMAKWTREVYHMKGTQDGHYYLYQERSGGVVEDNPYSFNFDTLFGIGVGGTMGNYTLKAVGTADALGFFDVGDTRFGFGTVSIISTDYTSGTYYIHRTSLIPVANTPHVYIKWGASHAGGENPPSNWANIAALPPLVKNGYTDVADVPISGHSVTPDPAGEPLVLSDVTGGSGSYSYVGGPQVIYALAEWHFTYP